MEGCLKPAYRASLLLLLLLEASLLQAYSTKTNSHSVVNIKREGYQKAWSVDDTRKHEAGMLQATTLVYAYFVGSSVLAWTHKPKTKNPDAL